MTNYYDVPDFGRKCWVVGGYIKADWEKHKKDPNLQQAAFDALSSENENALIRAGVDPTDTNKYVAHFLGAPKAAKVLQDPNAKLGDHLSPIVFKQNPNIKPDMKVSDMTAQFDKKLGNTPSTAVAAIPSAIDLTRSVGAADDPAERMRLALLKGEIPDLSKVPVKSNA
jgi:predicted methyltransferase MtxX (methanogen marker protein 4)